MGKIITRIFICIGVLCVVGTATFFAGRHTERKRADRDQDVGYQELIDRNREYDARIRELSDAIGGEFDETLSGIELAEELIRRTEGYQRRVKESNDRAQEYHSSAEDKIRKSLEITRSASERLRLLIDAVENLERSFEIYSDLVNGDGGDNDN